MEWMQLTISDQPSFLCSPSTHQWSSTHLCVKLSPFKGLGAYFTAIGCISHHPVLDALHMHSPSCPLNSTFQLQLFKKNSALKELLCSFFFLCTRPPALKTDLSFQQPALSILVHILGTPVYGSSPCQRWPLFSSIRCTPQPHPQASAHFPFALSTHSHSSLHLLQIDLSLGHHFRLISCSTYTAYFADLLFLQSSPTLLSLSWVLHMRRTSP